MRATVLNINYGRNRALLEACRTLGEYSWFVDRFRTHQAELRDMGRAVDLALESGAAVSRSISHRRRRRGEFTSPAPPVSSSVPQTGSPCIFERDAI